MKPISPSLHSKAKTGVVVKKINKLINVTSIQAIDQLLLLYLKTKELNI